MRIALATVAVLALGLTSAQAEYYPNQQRGSSYGYTAPAAPRAPSYPSVPSYQQDHSVRGYTNQNGTYVQPHRQTNPNSSRCDNYSSRGNVNPYTGQTGSAGGC